MSKKCRIREVVQDPCFEPEGLQIVMLSEYDAESGCFLRRQNLDMEALLFPYYSPFLGQWEVEDLVEHLTGRCNTLDEAMKEADNWLYDQICIGPLRTRTT